MSHEMFRNKNVYILNFRKNSSTNQTKRNQRDARTAEGDARSLYGMRCADLYGLVAFARCAARSLYGMRCADLCGLVVFARCVARSLYCTMRGPLRTGCICAMRCAVVVLRDALRGRCTGCDARTGCICAL